MKLIELPVKLVEVTAEDPLYEDIGIETECEEWDDVITIDIDAVEAFHSYSEKDTKVYFRSGCFFVINVPYKEFGALLNG